ncbi:MAG TPA: ABC transporter permease, partial [Ilumatobacteraceae bacterium]|nr:ABC transporter permease [Ilumatobacteraceae bacterium]
NTEPFETVGALGADGWVVPEGISGPFTALSAAPAEAADAVVGERASSVVVSRSSLQHEGVIDEVILIGHEAGGLGSAPTVDGRTVAADGEVVVDKAAGIDVGEVVQVSGQDFTVVGISENTTLLAGIPLVFTTLADSQQLVFRTNDVISAILVEGEPTAIPPGSKVMSTEDVAEDVLGPLEGAIASIDLVRVLLWIVAAIIIGAVVYLSALDRQRDFAVLKAVGAPNSALLGSLALQAVLVALSAVAVAAIIQIFLVPVFPLPVDVPARAFWQLPLLAVVVALLAGAAGMRKVLRSDPSQAFSGAGA